MAESDNSQTGRRRVITPVDQQQPDQQPDQAAQEEAARLAAEQAAREEADKAAAEQAALEQAAEEAKRAEAERIEAERLATEKAAQEAAERVAAVQAAAAEEVPDVFAMPAITGTLEMRAPDNCGPITLGGETYEADERGLIEIPAEFAEVARCHGFSQV